MNNMSREKLRRAVNVGLIAGLVAVSISAIGMVEAFNERDVITDILTLGQVLLFSTALVGGFLAVETKVDKKERTGNVLWIHSRFVDSDTLDRPDISHHFIPEYPGQVGQCISGANRNPDLWSGPFAGQPYSAPGYGCLGYYWGAISRFTGKN